MSTIARKIVGPIFRSSVINSQTVRTKVSTSSGAVLPKPTIQRLGKTTVTLFTIPFIYLGAVMSKMGAEYLEENDIFVPEDDDDD